MGWIINETAKAGPLAGKDKVCATIWDGAGYVEEERRVAGGAVKRGGVGCARVQ